MATTLWWVVVAALVTITSAINSTSCWNGTLPAAASPKQLMELGTPRDCTVSVDVLRNTSAIVVANQPSPLSWTVSFATASQIPADATATLFTCRDSACSTFDSVAIKNTRQPTTSTASPSVLAFQGTLLFPSPGAYSFVILVTLPAKINVVLVAAVVVESVTASPAANNDNSSPSPALTIALSALGGVVVLVGAVFVVLRWRRRRNLGKSVAMLQFPPPPTSDWDDHVELSTSRLRKTDTVYSSGNSSQSECTLGLRRPPPPTTSYPRHLVAPQLSPQSSICTGYDQYSVCGESVATTSVFTSQDNSRDTPHWRDSSSTFPASDIFGPRVTMLSDTSMDPEDSNGRRYIYPPR